MDYLLSDFEKEEVLKLVKKKLEYDNCCVVKDCIGSLDYIKVISVCDGIKRSFYKDYIRKKKMFANLTVGKRYTLEELEVD
ncbi:MAG: hypothetical protein RR370_00985 [Synergistaceae bacterium]